MRRFTESHEWIEVEEKRGRIGITEYAQQELGEIVYVELPQLNTAVEAGSEGAVLESTKAAADVYAPLSGEVVRINEALADQPGLVNASAEKEGWLFEIELSDPTQLGDLLDEEAYRSMVGR